MSGWARTSSWRRWPRTSRSRTRSIPRDLLWVGKKTEERLIAYGIHTIGDLAQLSVGQLTRLVGQKFATQLHENANGRDDSPVETEVQEAKSYSAERTFPKDLSDPKDIDRALFNVACIVAHRIRRDGFRASTVSMFVKYTDFSVAQKQCQTGQPTDITAVILNEARRMLAEVWDGVTPLRQVGLGVSKLTHPSSRIRRWNTTANGTASTTPPAPRPKTPVSSPTSGRILRAPGLKMWRGKRIFVMLTT